MTATSRTDRIIARIRAELEDQRPAIDAGTPLTSVSVIVHLYESGDVRRVQVRADRQRDIDHRGTDRRMLAGTQREDH
jgi:hypothetical protein